MFQFLRSLLAEILPAKPRTFRRRALSARRKAKEKPPTAQAATTFGRRGFDSRDHSSRR